MRNSNNMPLDHLLNLIFDLILYLENGYNSNSSKNGIVKFKFFPRVPAIVLKPLSITGHVNSKGTVIMKKLNKRCFEPLLFLLNKPLNNCRAIIKNNI
jgi:hypothetical protein